MATAVSASALTATSAFRKDTALLFRPSRATGTAPMTCAIVMANTMEAPLRGSPVSGIASRAKAMGPAACGLLNVPYASSQRASAPGPILRVAPPTWSDTGAPIFGGTLMAAPAKRECRKADRGMAADAAPFVGSPAD
jgi:hypothetical protein